MPGHPGTEKTRKIFKDDELVSFTCVCPFERIWRVRNGNGLIHRQEFHHAMWQS